MVHLKYLIYSLLEIFGVCLHFQINFQRCSWQFAVCIIKRDLILAFLDKDWQKLWGLTLKLWQVKKKSVKIVQLKKVNSDFVLMIWGGDENHGIMASFPFLHFGKFEKRQNFTRLQCPSQKPPRLQYKISFSRNHWRSDQVRWFF